MIEKESKPKRFYGTWLYIDFLATSSTGKTNIYQVVSKRKDYLGYIKWHNPWRCYAFFPEIDMIFEESCLNDIKRFLKQLKPIRIK